MIPEVFSYADAVDSLFAYCAGMDRDSADHPQMRRAVMEAYREVTAKRSWSNLSKTGRIHLRAAYSTGTITYTSSTRALLLVDGTWPSWAKDASVLIDDIVSDITSVDGLTATLDAVLCPRDDVDAGTSYSVFPRWYALPNDFASMSTPLPETGIWSSMHYVSPEEMAAWTRNNSDSSEIRRWTVRAPDDLLGSMALFVHPPADTDTTLDFPYKREPRPLRYSGHADNDSTGTITATAASDAIVGVSTAFASGMVGSLLRIGSDTARPEGVQGANPYVEQRVIASVTDSTNLTLDAAVSASASGVGYQIADPIDFHGDVWTALLRCAEKYLAVSRNFADRDRAERIAYEALRQAAVVDTRATIRRVAGGGILRRRWRLTDVDAGGRG